MTATVRKIDGMTPERLLDFADSRTDPVERVALLDLAGKWKHNWIPLDEIAAAIKAKRMKGDGIRRPSAPDVAGVRPAGKSRLDPKGAARHAAVINGSRSKGKPQARAASVGDGSGGAGRMAAADLASQHASNLYDQHVYPHRDESHAPAARLREVAAAHRNAAAEHHKAGSPAEASWHTGEANRLEAHAADQPAAADHSSQIRREIKVKKELRDGQVSFRAEHDNGTNVVSARIPQARGMTDHQHRLAAREALLKGIQRDHAGRTPRPVEKPEDVAKRLGMTFPKPTVKGHTVVGPGATVEGEKPRTLRDQSEAEVRRAAAGEVGGSDRYATNADLELQRRGLPSLGDPVTAKQPGIEQETHGVISGHKPGGMVEVAHKDRHGKIVRGTFNPAHVTHRKDGERMPGEKAPNDPGDTPAGKAEAAAKPAAPKKPRKPSALAQDWQRERDAQMTRFEDHIRHGQNMSQDEYFGEGEAAGKGVAVEKRLRYADFLQARRDGKEHERRQQAAYDAGAQLGARHGEADTGDPTSNDAEYAHHAAGHDSEMFGQGYTDGVLTGARRAEQVRAQGERNRATLAYGQARDAASTASNKAVRSGQVADQKAAVHAHVAAARAGHAAGLKAETDHHVKMAQSHKAAADHIAAREAAAAPPSAGPDASPAAAAKPDASRHAGVTVEHSGDGTLVHGTERGDTETTSALKEQGFKWSRNLNAWYLPRTWSESTRDTRVQGLKARLGDKIDVQRGSLAKSTSGTEERAQRIARAQELEQVHTDRAGKLDAEAQRRFDAADRATAGIPFGQPILVGHHSQRRHENALAKSHANMGAGVNAHQDAERARERASSAAARARLEEDPKFLARRLDRNQAEHRKVLRNLEHADPADAHTERLHAIRQDLEGKIGADQAAMREHGGGQHSKATITPGDIITYRGSHHVVHRTNAKTVTVPSQHERLAEAGYTETIPYSQISGHATLDKGKSESLRKLLERPTTPAAIKSRIRAILRDRGESTT